MKKQFTVSVDESLIQFLNVVSMRYGITPNKLAYLILKNVEIDKALHERIFHIPGGIKL